MSDMPSSGEAYAFGHDTEATQRLLTQGQLLKPFTRRLLEEAGITRGMKVLDVGCGPGDVSLLACTGYLAHPFAKLSSSSSLPLYLLGV